jgi:hypothetical protein
MLGATQKSFIRSFMALAAKRLRSASSMPSPISVNVSHVQYPAEQNKRAVYL